MEDIKVMEKKPLVNKRIYVDFYKVQDDGKFVSVDKKTYENCKIEVGSYLDNNVSIVNVLFVDNEELGYLFTLSESSDEETLIANVFIKG